MDQILSLSTRSDCSPGGEFVRYQTSDVRHSSRDCAGAVIVPCIHKWVAQCITSTHTRLFADDCLIYKEIRSQADADKLQVDLDALQEWEQQWMMSFHPQKCQLLWITRKKSPVKASYVIHGHTLAETDTAKYLGVSLHKHSSWSTHVDATAKKANGTRAFLQRHLRKAPTAVKMRTYESLIRPILEYSGVVWDPHTGQDANKLEMVQCRYARYTSRDYGQTSSVTAMLKTLGWEPLAERRASPWCTGYFMVLLTSWHRTTSYWHLQAEGPAMPSSAYHTRRLWHTSADSSPMARACGTPSQMRLQKQRASTPLRNGSPSFASYIEITPAPCK